MRYNYGNTTVYNTFIWPDPTPEQKRAIEEAAALVLEKRKAYAPAILAELYDPDNDFLYPELIRAHAQLDRAVEAAYGVDFSGDEAKITSTCSPSTKLPPLPDRGKLQIWRRS